MKSKILLFSFILFFIIGCDSDKNEVIDTNEDSAIELFSDISSENTDIAIVYFSRFNNTLFGDGIDAVSEVSIVEEDNIMYGNTEYIANKIASFNNGNLIPILTKGFYSNFEDETLIRHQNEVTHNQLPELRENIDISKFSTVFIGFPIWNHTIPQAVKTFVSANNWKGKTIIPFYTYETDQWSLDDYLISELKDGQLQLPLAIQQDKVKESESNIEAWLLDLEI